MSITGHAMVLSLITSDNGPPCIQSGVAKSLVWIIPSNTKLSTVDRSQMLTVSKQPNSPRI